MIFERGQVPQRRPALGNPAREDRILALDLAHRALEKSLNELRQEVAGLNTKVDEIMRQILEARATQSDATVSPGIIDLNDPPGASDWPPVDDDNEE